MARGKKNVPASVRARLLAIAHDRGEEFQRLLVQYALERFLYRLGRSEHSERFVLKGAMLFQIWEQSLPRATRDLDLLGIGDVSRGAIRDAVGEIWRVDTTEDGLEIDRDSLMVQAIREDAVYDGVRVRCRVNLDSAVIPLQIDVGAGDAVHPAAELVDYPTLLDFPAPRILAYPKEATVAEKTHAIVELGLLNSRLKDYFDIAYLARTRAFKGAVLQRAIGATFERRGTPLPQAPIEALGSRFANDPQKQVQWAAFQRRAGLEPEDLATVVERVQRFVQPVLDAAFEGSPFDQAWAPSGPWRSGR